MKKPLSVLALIVLGSTSSLFAGESPRQSREPGVRAGARPLALVIDPDGAPAQPSESLHYLLTRESQEHGVIYAFSTPEALERFVTRKVEPQRKGELGHAAEALTTCPDAWFKNTPGCSDSGSLVMACGQTNSYLSDSWNDRISCVQASGSWTILYKCYNFNRWPYNPDGNCSSLSIEGGLLYSDLNVYNFNNITSSIKVCPQGVTYVDCTRYY